MAKFIVYVDYTFVLYMEDCISEFLFIILFVMFTFVSLPFLVARCSIRVMFLPTLKLKFSLLNY